EPHPMHRFLLCPLVVLACLATSPCALASKEMQGQFEELAKQILDVTSDEPVTIGVFSQTGLPNSNAGPGLEGMLRDALLQRSTHSVHPDAKYEIKGDYAYVASQDDRYAGLKIIKIEIRIIDKQTATTLQTIPLTIELVYTQSVAELAQVTASIPQVK